VPGVNVEHPGLGAHSLRRARCAGHGALLRPAVPAASLSQLHDGSARHALWGLSAALGGTRPRYHDLDGPACHCPRTGHGLGATAGIVSGACPAPGVLSLFDFSLGKCEAFTLSKGGRVSQGVPLRGSCSFAHPQYSKLKCTDGHPPEYSALKALVENRLASGVRGSNRPSRLPPKTCRA